MTKRLLVWTALFAVASSGIGMRPPRQETARAAIARMYADYAWDTKDDSVGKDTPLFAASASVMGRYLDTELIKALLADRACAARAGGECNLSFDPMWDSQDPGGVTVQVVATKDPSVVQARIHYPYQNETRVVTYRLRHTPAGWRIVDMGGAKWPSLLHLLRPAVKPIHHLGDTVRSAACTMRRRSVRLPSCRASSMARSGGPHYG